MKMRKWGMALAFLLVLAGCSRQTGRIPAAEQNARIVARNMVFLMRSIALGREKYGLPEAEEIAFTHFIR